MAFGGDAHNRSFRIGYDKVLHGGTPPHLNRRGACRQVDVGHIGQSVWGTSILRLCKCREGDFFTLSLPDAAARKRHIAADGISPKGDVTSVCNSNNR